MKITIKITFTDNLGDFPISTRRSQHQRELDYKREKLIKKADEIEATDPKQAAELRERASLIIPSIDVK